LIEELYAIRSKCLEILSKVKKDIKRLEALELRKHEEDKLLEAGFIKINGG
jgi:hypothetical protein